MRPVTYLFTLGCRGCDLYGGESGAARSSQDPFHHRSSHVCQAKRTALELVGQPRVVDAEAVEDGGVQVVHVHRVAHDVVAEVVRFADVMPGLMPPPASHIVKQRGW